MHSKLETFSKFRRVIVEKISLIVGVSLILLTTSLSSTIIPQTDGDAHYVSIEEHPGHDQVGEEFVDI